jgi:uncharacterized protein YjeT (DUF2065 family)
MMQDIGTALGLVLVIEGLLYAVLAAPMKALIRAALDTPDAQLRISGVLTIALGVFVVWLARG